MEFFKYGEVELIFLKKKDRKLGAAIDRIGLIEREVIPDLFSALINSIVGQQISAKAAATVYHRMQERFGAITPQKIASATIAEIQQCGLSTRKAGYIKGIGTAVAEGTLNLSVLAALPDDEVIQRLSALNGIGEWTAEMLLIFSLERPDVVSWGDLAIQRGMIHLYGLRKLSRSQFERYRRRYSPYGSVASLYLWALAKK
ncbi:MAG TPA: DNA-3-methyladenine glycosylase 2 family protein [Firmicutes bacterium]|jgi:DNA-3-methyladenine glycosylase II|nr:DNA-3-methyladenine glycosylase 2 family protein [Bacillota bacterium]